MLKVKDGGFPKNMGVSFVRGPSKKDRIFDNIWVSMFQYLWNYQVRRDGMSHGLRGRLTLPSFPES